MTHPIAYVDADILLHRAVSFTENEFDGEEIALPRQALYFFDWMLASWVKALGKISDYHLIISVGPNFRKGLYEDYKGNRKNIIPHPAFHGLKEFVKERLDVYWEEGIEADDLIGIRVTESSNTIAVSADKDFATIPCKLFIPASHGRAHGEWYTFTEDQANLNWMRQALTGDVIDNYKGIPGVGPVKADKILPNVEPLEHLWAKVEKAFVC